MIAAFRRSTFARSIVFHKLEVVLAALVGVALFSERPSLLGWLGVAACGAGTLLINLAGVTDAHPLRRAFRLDAGGWLSIGSGVLLVITGFTLKDATAALLAANPELEPRRFVAAVHVLFHVVWIEVLVLSAALWLVRRHEIRLIPAFTGRLLPIGLTGLCASLCWFWAYPLSLVAYVKAVGQIEAVLSVALSLFLWKEREVWRQLPGVALMTLGIVLVLLR